MELQDIAFLLTFALFHIFAALSGAHQAITYSLKGAKAFDWNEHKIYVLQRVNTFLIYLSGYFKGLLTGLPITFAMLSKYWIDMAAGILILVITISASFSFTHNEFYYYTREKIAGRSYKFGQQSETDTAVISLGHKQRLILFLVSILFVIFWLQF